MHESRLTKGSGGLFDNKLLSACRHYMASVFQSMACPSSKLHNAAQGSNGTVPARGTSGLPIGHRRFGFPGGAAPPPDHLRLPVAGMLEWRSFCSCHTPVKECRPRRLQEAGTTPA